MELTPLLKKQIIAYARDFTGVEPMIHRFANRPGYMLVLETRHVEGFIRFVEWIEHQLELTDVKVIRTLPEEIETNPFDEFERYPIGFFDRAYVDFEVATEVNDGRISHMKNDKEVGGDVYAV